MFYEDYFNSIYSIQNRLIKKQALDRFIMGVSGPDASGKTAFSNEYSRFLTNRGTPCAIIHADDFLAPTSIRYKLDDPVESYYKHAFDHERLALLLETIIQAKPETVISYKAYCRETDSLSLEKNFTLKENMTVITEGVLLFKDPLKQLFNLKLFLYTDYSTIEKRVIQRDYDIFGEETLDRYRTKYFPVHEKHLSEDSPVSAADILIREECKCLNISETVTR